MNCLLEKIYDKIKNNTMMSISVFLIIAVFYYGICFFNDKQLVFTEADIFILFLLAICIISVSSCLILLISKNKILLNLIIAIKDKIEELIEINEQHDLDNNGLHFASQDILLKIKKDIEVVNYKHDK